MPDLVLFLFGLVGLWLGAELLTRSSLTIAKKMGLSQSFVGLTILAFGTDFPEIMVAITGAIEQKATGKDVSGIVIGNIIGSNMGQIALVLGVVGLIHVLKFKKEQIVSEGIMLVTSTLLFFLLAKDGMIDAKDGMIFLIFYLVYFIYLNKTLKRKQKKKTKSAKKTKPRKRQKIGWLTPILLIVGLAIIAEASHLVLTHGVEMATSMGVSQLAVGVILVGLGTSLPELVVSVNAAIKGANDLSVGNLIGSNIVDILIALGVSSQISSWTVDRRAVEFDLPYLLMTTVIVVLFLITKGKLEKRESLLVLSLYVVYVALKVGGF